MIDNEPMSGDLAERNAKLAPAGVRTALNIMTAWQLTNQQASQLLGIDGNQLNAWRQGSIGPLTDEQFHRLSYVLGIYRATHELLPKTADAWILKANAAPLFAGQTPLKVMSQGVHGLRSVRRYLEAHFV